MVSSVTSLAGGAGWRGCVCLRPVSNRIWQQGLWANAPCWAHSEALAGQFTSLRPSNVPPCSPPRRLGGGFLAHNFCTRNSCTHTQLFYTQLSHTQLVQTHTSLFCNFLTHTTLAHTTVSPSYITPFKHTHNPSTYDFVTGNLSHTQLGHTQSFTHIILSHTAFTHNFITHNSSHTTFLTYRSSTTSFVFPSFPVPLQLLFLLIGRSWLEVTRSFNWLTGHWSVQW